MQKFPLVLERFRIFSSGAHQTVRRTVNDWSISKHISYKAH